MQLYYIRNEYYDHTKLIPRSILVRPYPDSIIRYNARGSYYDIFPSNWKDCFSTRHIRSNLKNNAFPCIDLDVLYSKPFTDPVMYAQGKILGDLLKNTPVIMYCRDTSFVPKIPTHIVLHHLSEWTGVNINTLRRKMALSTLKIVYLLGLTRPEVDSLKDFNVSLI